MHLSDACITNSNFNIGIIFAMSVFDRFRVLINKHGLWMSILLTTVFSVFMSVAFTAIVLITTEISQISNRIVSGMLTAAIVAVTLTPMISYMFFNLLYKLEKAETELRVLAQTDSLTNVMNRRYFAEVADRILADSQFCPVSVILVDMNNFKDVNDTHGHLVGDRVLVTFCDSVRGIIRDSDIFGRFGGDEFIFLLLKIDQQDVYGVLDGIHSALKRLNIKADDGSSVDLSVSAGIYCSKCDMTTNLDDLIQNADRALYEAKKKSRNSTEILSYSFF